MSIPAVAAPDAASRLRFAKFVGVSAVAAAANVGSRALFSLVTNYAVAVALAFCVGVASAFVLNRQFVFDAANGPVAKQAGWFVAVNLFGLGLTLLVSVTLRWLLLRTGLAPHAELIAHVAGVAAPVVTSYVGHSRLSFALRPAENRQ